MTETKANILIVDDRADKLLALEAVLEDLGQNIVVAQSGRDALRHLLSKDFAVILLDINMPGMDGFETAGMIRQRASSRRTPIIFITAFGDEMHAVRGYSLGAVDYILAPVMPNVLRAKVSVFVELFFKTEEIKWQAESLRRRAAQLQKLSAASLVINSALSTQHMLRTIADTARDIVGAHQTILLYKNPAQAVTKPLEAVTSFSEKYDYWRDRPIQIESYEEKPFLQNRMVVRLSDLELQKNPVSLFNNEKLPPARGILAAQLTARDGSTLGLVYLSDRIDGDFTADDEAILVQLAQMGSIALENTIYAQERHVNRIKDEFLATLSHELRTPLNAILGWTQLLRCEHLTGETSHGLEVIERNAKAQTKLIEDLLDVSRIATGKMQLKMTRSTMSPIVQAAFDAALPAAHAKQITLTADLQAAGDQVMMDPDRMQQVIWNLLSNAIKFTPAGGSILVSLTECVENSPMVKLAIQDTGQGIEPKFLPYVFDRFRQADSTSTRTHGGLGIGLAIVRHVIEQHGGVVSAKSEGVGCGSTFAIELPAIRQEVSTALPTAVGENHRPHNGKSNPAITGVRVLLVDDETDACEVVAAMLRHAGAIVCTADSAAGALEQLAEFKPDILLSDIAMPGTDGYALVRQIRKRSAENFGDLPAVALTAYARAEDRVTALSAGFQDHLTKPIDPAAVLHCISQLTRESASAIAGRN